MTQRLGYCLIPAMVSSLALLGGCSILPSRHDSHPVHQYRIEPAVPTNPQKSHPADCTSIKVDKPTSAPGFGGTDMRYSNQHYRIGTFVYHRWIAPPADMLTQPLVEQLRASDQFTHVIDNTSPIPAALLLNTQLISLVQVFKHAHHSQVRLVIEESLIDTQNNHILAARQFITTSATAPNPVAGVAATNRSVTHWAKSVRQWLSKKLSTGYCQKIHLSGKERPNPQ